MDKNYVTKRYYILIESDDQRYIQPISESCFRREYLFDEYGYDTLQLAEEALTDYLQKHSCYEHFIIVPKYRKE